ncbi:aldo/keto reductase [Agrobacterium rubi]|uniref:Putative pyridoxal 4-dehydrogenase n=1 Tax=Agrobacterium rubi TR3 = NBRC 13261 TaxID=1368415 RepID=A0A081CTD6_9HYPH|nr:aldo/keto reductase [Agrobacterium rubi]MBP1878551.1 D-threo-aldose 1-dehydrogenase [Agrobacterium rubi]NTF10186.1 aldo/keto reductase [Agrobacterium rubi]NTF21636.1 aldo/keto reductase [Agrobacterium rubi]NTF28493.1 aldo/keto reductase [Agrobacterium rubi]GAK69932.1 putative pyridoxal 4-dehydrogenase [Agrobacterium rubi TR3 = NBRC 13261]
MKVSDRRKLPRVDLDITVFGLGCAQMGNLYRVTPYDDAKATFDATWEAGARYFDTAPYYGFTRSELRLGTMLCEHPRKDYVVSTKVGRLMTPDATVGAYESDFVDPLPFRPVFDYSYDGIMRSFEASQSRLGILAPDILFVHDIGPVQHGDKHQHYWDQITTGGGFRALDDLRREGSVKAVGLGVNDAGIIRQAMDVFDLDIAMLAGRYTALEQESLGVLDTCAERGVGIVVAGVFNSGLLAGNRKFNYADAPTHLLERVEVLETICKDAGVSLPAVALQFVTAHPAVVSVVSGARNASQIKSNIDWFEEDIPASVWRNLQERGIFADGTPLPTGEMP